MDTGASIHLRSSSISQSEFERLNEVEDLFKNDNCNTATGLRHALYTFLFFWRTHAAKLKVDTYYVSALTRLLWLASLVWSVFILRKSTVTLSNCDSFYHSCTLSYWRSDFNMTLCSSPVSVLGIQGGDATNNLSSIPELIYPLNILIYRLCKWCKIRCENQSFQDHVVV